MKAAKVQILPLRRAPRSTPRESAETQGGTPSSVSDNGQPTTQRRVRAYKPKVRTGCLTCKIRRVKCDEAQPACLKCTSTGRKCDGYMPPPPRKGKSNSALVHVSNSPQPTRGLPLSPIRCSSTELRALEYFCVRTAPDMGMYFDSDFWGSFVVQASVAEPALRHAMVAMGVFNQQRQLGGGDRKTASQTGASVTAHPTALHFPATGQVESQNTHVAIVNYNKSISLLSEHMSTTPESTDTVALACILFICIEFLRGDDRAALRHFKGGMAIINNTLSTTSRGSRPAQGTIERIKSSLSPFFHRLEMLYTLFGHDTDWTYPVSLPSAVPDAFYSLSYARDSIVHLMNLSLRFIRPLQPLCYEPSPMPSSVFDEQAALLSQLQLWRSHFSDYRAKNASRSTPNHLYASNLLEIQFLIALTWVSIATTPLECAHDAHISAYTKVVSLAEQLSTIASTHSQSARFSNAFLLDVEIIGPLHWVAIKCRDPSVRRRAIAVLRSTHRREGLWDSKLATAIAERVVVIEEAGLTDGELPCEESRVHNAFVPSWMDPGIGPSTHLGAFHMKPYGVYGDWLIWQEQITLD